MRAAKGYSSPVLLLAADLLSANILRLALLICRARRSVVSALHLPLVAEVAKDLAYLNDCTACADGCARGAVAI